MWILACRRMPPDATSFICMLLSRKSILVDAGPLIALGTRRDGDHLAAVSWASKAPAPLISTWAVIAEASHFLGPRRRVLFTNIAIGAMRIEEICAPDMPRLIAILDKYPQADFADASLVLIAERLGITEVATLDVTDFAIYRTSSGKPFTNVFHR